MCHELPAFFYEIFTVSMPRLGPGDDQSTKKAIDIVLSRIQSRLGAPSSEKIRILDIGCGNGDQTIQVAKHTDSIITAVDNHQAYLDELMRRAGLEGISGQIIPLWGDMAALDMEPGSFDIVWAEGSLFVMGFADGLALAHHLLAPHGILAASELAWLRKDVPKECREFFAGEYPAMTTIDANLAQIRNSGFTVVDYFVLPESSWEVPYYLPMEKRLNTLRMQYTGDPEKMPIIDSLQAEIDVFRKYSRYYSNVFYIMERT